MFIGYYEMNGEPFYAIYYKNRYGYKKWCEDTFSPSVENIRILDFKIKGKTYEERKADLVDLAIDWQINFSSLGWSYGELAEFGDYFQRNGKRYGLLQEFKENAIC